MSLSAQTMLAVAGDFPADGVKRANLESLCLISHREVPHNVIRSSTEEAPEPLPERAMGML
ncbi:MAG: hypothetical protein HXY37_04855 [Chloroflexi bacterium]|nr:hypothetical protein [Chloroflexota bacterium]